MRRAAHGRGRLLRSILISCSLSLFFVASWLGPWPGHALAQQNGPYAPPREALRGFGPRVNAGFAEPEGNVSAPRMWKGFHQLESRVRANVLKAGPSLFSPPTY